MTECVHGPTISSVVRPFTREQIRDILAEHGYTTNPQGLVQFSTLDYVCESEGVAYLDVPPDAVRKGDEVPDRPVRMRFQEIPNGLSHHWKSISVEELKAGVESKCPDRYITQKISPWPDKMAKKSG